MKNEKNSHYEEIEKKRRKSRTKYALEKNKQKEKNITEINDELQSERRNRFSSTYVVVY